MSTFIKTKEDLDSRKSAYRESLRKYKYKVLVCGGAGCLSSNCAEVQVALKECLKKNNLEEDVCLLETGCIGSCAVGPLIVIEPENVLYTNVTPSMAWEILESHIISGHVIEEYTFYDLALNKNVARIDDITFFKEQTKIALKNCGTIDHGSIDAYIAANGYQAIYQALQGSREDVVKVVKDSGLRGRGGGGFPTGIKWEAALKVESDQKYMVCNADEGDPGAFMDRSLLEGDPHGIIEGMMIGGYAMVPVWAMSMCVPSILWPWSAWGEPLIRPGRQAFWVREFWAVILISTWKSELALAPLSAVRKQR